tara:strand:+ start:30688 stop:32385 length:1698 start_codon:yes stop_codon:yes gene_type:complete
MPFRTKLDYSDNRQIKQRVRTNTTLSGATVFGVSFSALTTGPDLSNQTTTETVTSVLSTFSGNSATTVFTWYDSRMELGATEISAITPSNSGITQNVGPIYTANTTTVIDGNSVTLTYTGVSFDLQVTNMLDSGGSYTGTVEHDSVSFLSATTLDFTGRTIWIDNKEIIRTKKLIVTENPQIGYVLTCADSEGKVEYKSVSAVTSGATFWEEDGTNLLGLKDDKGGHKILGVSDYSLIAGGSGNTFNTTTYSFMGGGYSSLLQSCSYSSIVGGVSNSIISANYSFIGGGNTNTILTDSSNCGVIGGNTNKINGTLTNSVILGGTGITALTSNTAYVPDLVIDGLINVSDLQTNGEGLIIDGASDITLKKNINSINDALNTILKLNPVSFEWVEEINLREGTVFGLVAQEVIEVIPEIVRNRAKGNGTLTIEHKELIPWIIGAIKELATNSITLTKNKELILETQTIAAEDNNIELNYNGTKQTALNGGITIVKGIDDNTNSEFIINSDGDWITNNHIIPKGLIIPEFTPKSTNDTIGKLGEITRDDNYIYIKGNNGWGRSSLETF